MPIPKELRQYSSEDDFTQRFLIPLLQRLAYSVVMNYHGKREFGKDLIFAESDKFGHVCYYGLQAKFVDSISLNGIESLIKDCVQAFVNPLQNPQTGECKRIGRFYAINAGNISDQAREHFFNSLLPSYGDNVRLIDGQAILSIDRCSAVRRAEDVGVRLSTLLSEIGRNNIIFDPLVIESIRQAGSGVIATLDRVNVDAASRYFIHPIFSERLFHLLSGYLDTAIEFNRKHDALMIIGSNAENSAKLLNEVSVHAKVLQGVGKELEKIIREILHELGPLASSFEQNPKP